MLTEEQIAEIVKLISDRVKVRSDGMRAYYTTWEEEITKAFREEIPHELMHVPLDAPLRLKRQETTPTPK